MIMQDHELLAAKGQFGIRSAAIVREFYFVNVGIEQFDDRPNLAAAQPAIGQVDKQCNDIVELSRQRHHSILIYKTTGETGKVFSRPNNPQASHNDFFLRTIHLQV